MEKKLFLLDAFALIFRRITPFIRNPRITSKGKNTNAHLDSPNTLVDLLNKQKPTHMAICFDTAAPTEDIPTLPTIKPTARTHRKTSCSLFRISKKSYRDLISRSLKQTVLKPMM